MNKLEKILAQSVTSEMVAKQLTEQEIEEVIEEYETKIANAEDDIEVAKEREQMMRERAERSFKRAEDWKHVVENEVEQVEVWRSVVNKAKQALKEKISSPNEQRAKLIEEAKEYIEKFKDILQVTVFEGGAVDIDCEEGFIYPKELVWNDHIAKAYGMARILARHKDVSKFGEDAIQPTEIVEGMDVELYIKSLRLYSDGKFYASGAVSHYDKASDRLAFSEVYEKGSGVDIKEGDCIYDITSDGFKILDDTKAKYKEEDK